MSNFVWVFFILQLWTQHAIAGRPPVMTRESPTRQIVFEADNSVRIPCVADGDPAPRYEWTFNDRIYDPSGQDNDVTMQTGVGTLLFSRPSSRNEGFYICRAINDFGTAVAGTIQMLNASLGTFPNTNQKDRIAKIAGKALHINCVRPESYPAATVIWRYRIPAGFTNIDYNDRITMDPDGGLNFAYVTPEDAGEYRCSAFNAFLKKEVNSKITELSVSGVVGDVREPPTFNWIARTSETFIRGTSASIKCVFAGRPVPNILWARSGGKPVPHTALRRSYGMELYFTSIDYSDAGAYECSAFNEAQSTATKATVLMDVQGHMTWVHKPEPVTIGVNQSYTFICRGEGNPPPEMPRWFKNYVRIQGRQDNIIIGDEYGPGTTLTIQNVKITDTMALQCNITNGLRGSWVFSSFYLNVQSEKPSIVQFDEGPHKWAADHSYNLTCKVFGAPIPVISWKKNDQSLTGGRYVKHDDGTLEVKKVGITDGGTYTCTAENMHGTDQMSTDVVVRRKTQIKQAPEDLSVTARTQAKFVCTALTDPDEAVNLRLTWLKDGLPLNYVKNNRIYSNVQDNSLQIAGPIALDSGLYTCVASNGIDEARASATLRVQDRPDHPVTVAMEECNNKDRVRIKWSPGTNNNAPITNYIVQYRIATDMSMWYTVSDNITWSVTQYDVPLKPNNMYWFRVLSQNKIGISEPSNPTSDFCQTQSARPQVNPKGVRTIDEGEAKLVISWQPISPIDFGGNGFMYITRFRKVGSNRCHIQGQTNKDWCEYQQQALEGSLGRAGELNIIEYKTEVGDQPTYTKYNITVISRNSDGESSAPAQYIIGYSGESKPKQIVSGFQIAKTPAGKDMVYADNVTLVWSAVDESEQETQGFFRGYVIRYKKIIVDAEDEYSDHRYIYIVLRDARKEGLPGDKTLEENSYGAVENPDGTVTVTIDNLPANSELAFEIAVMNKGRYGDLSPAITVKTEEGVPGPVQQLRLIEKGPTHVKLNWIKPLEPNGNITRYLIGFKFLNGLHLGPLQYPEDEFIPAPSDKSQKTVTAKVTGLKPLQSYRFYVWAYTSIGQGSEYFIDDATVAAGYPGAPTITVERLANNKLNVSWVPSDVGVPANVFYVQFKQESAIDQWQRTGWEVNNYYLIVEGFAEGWRYEVRVVASNGGIYETASESEKIFPTATSRSAAEAKEVFTSAWFIGLLIALLLIAFLLFMLIYLKKNVGGYNFGDFSADETEPLKGPHDYDEKSSRGPEMMADDAPVSERYAPSHFSDRYAPSQHSERYVGSQPPPADEFMHDDPNKYGEEASFIGQYKHKQELPEVRSKMPSDPYGQGKSYQPAARQPPTEPQYSSGPTPEPRGRYPSRGEAPRQPPPRTQPRATPSESSNDYRPQYRQPYQPAARQPRQPAPPTQEDHGETDV